MAHDPHRERVVVVADVTPTRRHLAQALRDSGVDVFAQRDTADLLDFALWAEPAVVILGLADPCANLAALQALRAQPALSGCAIVFVAPAPPLDPPPGTDIDHRLDANPTPAGLQHVVARHLRRRQASRSSGEPA